MTQADAESAVGGLVARDAVGATHTLSISVMVCQVCLGLAWLIVGLAIPGKAPLGRAASETLGTAR